MVGQIVKDPIEILGKPDEYCPVCARHLDHCRCLELVDFKTVFRMIMEMKDPVMYIQQKKLLQRAEDLFIFVSQSLAKAKN